MPPDAWPRRPPPETTGPRYEFELTRAAELRAVRAGLRTWLPRVLDGADEDGSVLDTLLLAVDELASNGLRHGAAPVRVHAAPTAQGLLLDVSDEDPAHGPEPAVDRDPALGGMGLHMVARLTGERGWTVAGDRKHVWACLRTEEGTSGAPGA
jgi:anti-sigma regulatory factor (Ser/Thr protein kinase)